MRARGPLYRRTRIRPLLGPMGRPIICAHPAHGAIDQHYRIISVRGFSRLTNEGFNIRDLGYKQNKAGVAEHAAPIQVHGILKQY